MKIIKITILFTILSTTVRAQQDYKTLLNTLYKKSENGFKDISGPVNDTSSFVDCTIKPSIGNIKIMKTSFATTLNWEIPLAKSNDVQKAVKEFIETNYNDKMRYKTAISGTEDEGDKITNVYALKGDERPLVVFKAIYYKDNHNPEKSSFAIVMYGK